MLLQTWIPHLIFLLPLCGAVTQNGCLKTKTVGAICYELLYKIPEPFANCLTGCVYKELTDDSPNPRRICFAAGSLPVSDSCLG